MWRRRAHGGQVAGDPEKQTPAMRVRRGGFLLSGWRYFDALTM